MPDERFEEVLHVSPDGMRIVPTRREIPTYDEARLGAARRARRHAYPGPFAEHEPGECVECDALRVLQREER